MLFFTSRRLAAQQTSRLSPSALRTLGLQSNEQLDEQELKQAYRAKVLEVHPDVIGGGGAMVTEDPVATGDVASRGEAAGSSSPAVNARLREIIESYKILQEQLRNPYATTHDSPCGVPRTSADMYKKRCPTTRLRESFCASYRPQPGGTWSFQDFQTASPSTSRREFLQGASFMGIFFTGFFCAGPWSLSTGWENATKTVEELDAEIALWKQNQEQRLAKKEEYSAQLLAERRKQAEERKRREALKRSSQTAVQETQDSVESAEPINLVNCRTPRPREDDMRFYLTQEERLRFKRDGEAAFVNRRAVPSIEALEGYREEWRTAQEKRSRESQQSASVMQVRREIAENTKHRQKELLATPIRAADGEIGAA